MSSKKSLLLFILDQLHGFEDITYKYMFGEYLFQYKKKTILLTIDGACFTKVNEVSEKYFTEKQVPYPGFKEWFKVDVEDTILLRDFVEDFIKNN